MKLDVLPLPSSRFRLQDSALCWRWIVATMLGFGISLFFVEVGERTELGAIEGTIGGIIIGLLQALMIGQYLPPAWLWIIANGLAWGLMAASGWGAMGWIAPDTDLLGMRLILGAFFGITGGLWLSCWQLIVISNSILAARWWLIVNPLAWSLGLSLGWTVGGILRSLTHLFLAEVVGLAVTWLIVATVTGIGLARLQLRSQKTLVPRKM